MATKEDMAYYSCSYDFSACSVLRMNQNQTSPAKASPLLTLSSFERRGEGNSKHMHPLLVQIVDWRK